MYCPTCRSEYRPQFTRCAKCDVALVESLEAELEPIIDEETVRVGISGENGLSKVIEAGGRDVDLGNSFPYDVAVELVRDLEQERIAAVLRELTGVEFPDKRVRYEVHVRVADHTAATRALHERWKRLAQAEVGAVASADDVEKCPACGASVPLSVAECPDCGLTVGVMEDAEPSA